MNSKKAISFALIAFIWWGLSPLYWSLLKHTPGSEVLAYRIFFCLIILFLILIGLKKVKGLRQTFKDKKTMGLLLISSSMIGTNWYAFIYSINSNQVMQTSLGYFINPLLNVVIAYLFFKEELKVFEKVSLLIALCGVIILSTLGSGFPWLSLIIATTFATYSAIRKIISLDTFQSLFIETLYLLIPVTYFIINLEVTGEGHITSYPTNILLILGGAVTLTPLIFFSVAAKNLEFKMLGFIQYISPSIHFLLSVLYYKEPFHKEQLAAFSLIWLSLAIYSIKNFMTIKKNSIKI
jgi:chloramphenicol-sensitive protein RarD